MKQFAFLNNDNIVTTIVVSESIEKLSEIPGGNAGIELPEGHSIGAGYVYNPTDNTFTEPTEDN